MGCGSSVDPSEENVTTGNGQGAKGKKAVKKKPDVIVFQCPCKSCTLEVSGDPFFSAYCHCSQCRRTTAAPYNHTAGYNVGKVKLVDGSVNGHAINRMVRNFCTSCGTFVFGHDETGAPTDKQVVPVSLMPSEWRPAAQFHLFCDDAIVPGLPDDSVPKFSGPPGSTGSSWRTIGAALSLAPATIKSDTELQPEEPSEDDQQTTENKDEALEATSKEDDGQDAAKTEKTETEKTEKTEPKEETEKTDLPTETTTLGLGLGFEGLDAKPEEPKEIQEEEEKDGKIVIECACRECKVEITGDPQRSNAHGAAILKKMDVDNSGQIDKSEFIAAGGTEEEFARLDINGDGSLDQNELSPNFSAYCHCSQCRQTTGAPFNHQSGYNIGQVNLVSGEVKTHTINRMARNFCVKCGTYLFGHDETGAPTDKQVVPVSLMPAASRPAAQFHLFCDDAAVPALPDDRLPKFSGATGSDIAENQIATASLNLRF